MKFYSLIAVTSLLLLMSPNAFAQFGEPPVEKKENPRNLYEEGYTRGFGFSLNLTDFGFSGGGQYRIGVNKYTELLATLKISGLRDPSEQTYVDYYFGFRTIPNKYRRIISFPLQFGIKERLFAKDIRDNFRVYTTASAGPVFALSYAYFDDANNNGFRENDAQVYNGYQEQVYDVFSGFKESKTHWGIGGEFGIGIDFGEDFGNLSSVQFGYTMNYFDKGIQVLEPRAPVESGPLYDDEGNVRTVEANSPRKYFGSAQITFVFGWMW